MQTERLLIRLIKESDIDSFFAIVSSDKISEDMEPIKTISKAKEYLLKAEDDAINGKRYVFAGFDKSTKKMVGFIELKINQGQIGSISCIIAQEFWNKGIGSEAMMKVEEFAVEKLKLKKLLGVCSLFNPSCTSLFKNVLGYNYISTDLIDGKDYLNFEKKCSQENETLKTDLLIKQLNKKNIK